MVPADLMAWVGRVEEWKNGKVDEWKGGRVDEWKGG